MGQAQTPLGAREQRLGGGQQTEVARPVGELHVTTMPRISGSPLKLSTGAAPRSA